MMKSKRILDVREHEEYASERVAESLHCPLSELPAQAARVLRECEGDEIVILCRSGARAKVALQELERLGLTGRNKFTIYPGGILEWKRLGQPVVSSERRAGLPIMRQVQLIAGLMILGFLGAARWIAPEFGYGAAFVGLGLTVAGATGFCGMAHLLALAPWNRAAAKTG